MAGSYRMEKTPVLIFADLDPALQIADDDPCLLITGRLGPRRQYHRTADVRCQARARGDSAVAIAMKMPVDGGYRCRQRVHDSGLCRRHETAAPPAIRQRAHELYQVEKRDAIRAIRSVVRKRGAR